MSQADGNIPAERFISYALRIGALELIPEGRPLKSGRVSPYFFNSGLFNTGDSLSHLAQSYAAAIEKERFRSKVIFGPAYKGIPLSVAIALTIGGDTGYAFNRKEEKGHGEGGSVVGVSLKGKNVLIVDDVITTGSSSGEAVEIIKAHGGVPIGCVIAFDRQECGNDGNMSATQEFQKNYEIPVLAVATLADLISFLGKIQGGVVGNNNFIPEEMLNKILLYQKQYGIP